MRWSEYRDKVLARVLLWRLLGFAAFLLGAVVVVWLLHGSLGAALRGHHVAPTVASPRAGWVGTAESLAALLAASFAALALLCALLLLAVRWRARGQRRYVRLRVEPYRTDRTSVEGIVAMFESLHKRVQRRWWRRLLRGQPSVSLEVHHVHAADGSARALLALTCPFDLEKMVGAAVRSAYPNCRVTLPCERRVALPSERLNQGSVSAGSISAGLVSAGLVSAGSVSAGLISESSISARSLALLRLKKHAEFIRRVKQLDRYELAREPPMDRLLNAMGACGEDAFVQLALTPTPALFERYARWRYRHHENRLSRERREHVFTRDRSLVEEVELRGGLAVQHRPLYFVDVRVGAPSRAACERIASELRAEGAENRLVERGTAVRHGLLGLYARRVARGEGNPWPPVRKGVFASTELAALWHLPSVDYAAVPFARGSLPLAPAPPAIMRPRAGAGLLRDALGPVAIHPEMRRQNTAVPGAVEQGKSSYLVATVAEDLRRERCAVIVLDPKGDAAEAAVSLVAPGRTCTLLDFSHPTCGFNPLAVHAPADVIADYVVGALKHLFTDSDIRASSDRYLRNAIIAVLAHDPGSSLWDAARLLSVGEEGYAYRARVGAHVRTLPEFKEIAQFFTAELTAQLADSRSTTTAKLDAPVNKLARLLNSPSIKRVLLNDSLTVDFDRMISGHEVLVVKGALGSMGAGNTSVLMQLLVGMLDAALARQQDTVPADRSRETLASGDHPRFDRSRETRAFGAGRFGDASEASVSPIGPRFGQRVAVALKVDEAPLVLNRGFAETLALKRSAGLETVACWQTDAQWTDREVREQLDALFAHRVYFATASVRDARAAASLMMAEFSDTVRPEILGLSALGHPDARLHLPKHHAIVSWSTPQGRQPPFVAQTIPLRVDPERLQLHAARQSERGGRYLADLSQPHWERSEIGRRHGGREETAHSQSPSVAAPPNNHMPLPETAAESYAELVDLDAAHSVRWARSVTAPRSLKPDALDLEILALIATMRHVLTTQIHRRFNAERNITTTQRRLKRLSGGGFVARFQFHRRDGGGAPMCYVMAPLGLELLGDRGHLLGDHGHLDTPTHGQGDQQLRQARHEVHVAGWALALERALGGPLLKLHGPAESVLAPPLQSISALRVAIGPRDLRLPGGRMPHDFLRTDATGARVEAERFETVRPDASVETPGRSASGAVCLLVERDDRLPTGSAAAKLERYDHLLAGWSVCAPRFTRRDAPRPLVVFLCRDRPRARECARCADHVLGACRAYAGEYPRDWEYPGRAGILFASERDVHQGLLLAYGVPSLPPEVRAADAPADPGARAATCEPRELLTEKSVPRG